MREVPVSRDDIDDLAENIDALDLSDSQRALLSGIVAVIRELIQASESSVNNLVLRVADQQELVVARVGDKLPSLRDQIRGAFTPGALGHGQPTGPMKVGEGVVRPTGPMKVGEGVVRPTGPMKVGEGVVRPTGPMKVGEGVFGPAGPPVADYKRSERGYGGVSSRRAWPASRHPDDDIDLLAANALAYSHANFTYQGGPVISNPKVFTSYWGPKWEENRELREDLDQFVKALLASEYMNILSQYGVGSGAGKAGMFVGNSMDSTVSGELTDANIHARIQHLIDTGKLPEPATSADVVALIFLDDGITINDTDLGVVICEPTSDTAFGYHYFFTTSAGGHFYYAIIPGLSDDCLRKSCLNNDENCSLKLEASVEQRLTQVASHEFAEMVTDPEINAWRDSGNGAEVSDICNGESATITVSGRPWTVQKMYSYYDEANSDQPCAVNPSSPRPNLLVPYQPFILRTGTPLRRADTANSDFAIGDYTGTGPPDLFCLKPDTETGHLEVQVLSGASNYQQVILRTGTPLRRADTANSDFAIGDYTGTGPPDLFCLKPDTETGHLEVQVLSGASNYQRFILRTGTPLRRADTANSDFAIGDYTGTGPPDLFCLKPDTETGHLEVQVLSGASNYQQFALVTGTPLSQADTANSDFAIGDYTGTGPPDLFCLKPDTETGHLEVQVLSGASNYQQFALVTGTPLSQADTANSDFAIGDYTGTGPPDLFCLKPDTETGHLEVQVLSGAPYLP